MVFRPGLYGILTLSFLISGVICFIGFLIFWILTMRGRVLEFGILRSMGLSTGRLIGMMGIEQVLTSLAASGAGILIGLIASKIFIPFFQIAYSTADQVPAFAVISSPDDLAKIYVFVSVILAVGLGILGWMLSRINMNQALKLGED